MKAPTLPLLWLIGGFLAEDIGAADCCTSPGGQGANTGSLDSPWRTVQRATSTLAAGSTAFLRGDDQSEKMEIRFSGNAVGGGDVHGTSVSLTAPEWSDHAIPDVGAK